MDDMKTLLEVLSEINDEIDFETETGLIEQGWIDSLDLMRIIAALNVAFDIRITTGTLSLRISTALRRCSRSCVSIGKKHDAVRAGMA